MDKLCQLAGKIFGGSYIAGRDWGKLGKNRFVRFLLAGVVNTLFGFMIYGVLVVSGLAAWLALLIATILGVAFNFFTTGSYVFQQLLLTRLPRFVTCYALVYGINLMLLELLAAWLGDKILSQAILMFPVAMISYSLMARFVFVKNV